MSRPNLLRRAVSRAERVLRGTSPRADDVARAAEVSTPTEGRPEFSMFRLVTGLFGADDAAGGRIVLDVGAQRGQYSRAFAELGFDVRAFEASPPNYEELVERMRPFPNVTPIHVAVSDTDADEVKFFYSEEFIGVNSLKVNSAHLDRDTYAVVETVRLDTHLGDDLPKVEVVKTDIEGADLLALRGFDFHRHTPRIVLSEYGKRSEAFGYGVADLVDHLRPFGYVAWCSNYDSGSGLPFSAKTGCQAKVALRYFGAFDRCPDPNWGDVVFFREPDRAALTARIADFDMEDAVVDLEP